jgi:hypothetical protein
MVTLLWVVLLVVVAGMTGSGLGSCGLYGPGAAILVTVAFAGLLGILPVSVFATAWVVKRMDRRG